MSFDVMDVYETRRRQLRRIIDNHFDGIVKRCADALDMKPPQLHRWLSHTSKDRRRIEYDSARTIEERLSLDPMSMDRDQSHTPEAKESLGAYSVGKIPSIKNRWPFSKIDAKRFFALLPEERAAIEERLEQWIEAYEARSRKGPSQTSS